MSTQPMSDLSTPPQAGKVTDAVNYAFGRFCLCYSNRELARKMGVSHQLVWTWATRRQLPTFAQALQIIALAAEVGMTLTLEQVRPPELAVQHRGDRRKL